LNLINQFILICLRYFLLFFIGTIAGWGIEIFWRKFFGKARRWINPGFLNGPWLPLYGFGCIFLYMLCLPQWPIYIKIPAFMISLTLLELLAGIIFIDHFKIKLWDYSASKWNFRGLICPLYSIFWTILGLIFSYFIYPFLENIISVLYMQLQLSLIIGFYGGLFAADMWHSFNLASRIRTFVTETEEKWPVDFERLKLEMRDRVQEGFINRTHFFLPFHGELGISFKERLKHHIINYPRPKSALRLLRNKIRKD